MKQFYLVCYWPQNSYPPESRQRHAADNQDITVCGKKLSIAWWILDHHCKDFRKVTCPVCRKAKELKSKTK